MMQISYINTGYRRHLVHQKRLVHGKKYACKLSTVCTMYKTIPHIFRVNVYIVANEIPVKSLCFEPLNVTYRWMDYTTGSVCVHAADRVQGCSGCLYRLLGFFLDFIGHTCTIV